MKKYLLTILIISLTLLSAELVVAEDGIVNKLSGRILLQMESHGEAWYVNPFNFKRYYLGRPTDAFNLMQNLGTGITNNDLEKIPIGLIDYNDNDDDNDGLSNRLEMALGTDQNSVDTDNDGYNDFVEIQNSYNPLDTKFLPIDKDFTKNHLGKIFIQTEKNGEAWYVNPNDNKRYYLGRPTDAFTVMKKFGLGITNSNLNNINISYINPNPDTIKPSPQTNPQPIITNPDPSPLPTKPISASDAISGAASAIRSGDKTKATNYFTEDMHIAIKYTIDYLNAEGRLTLGNILSAAKPTESAKNEIIYSTEVYFSLGGYKVPIEFHIQKQENGSWLLTNL